MHRSRLGTIVIDCQTQDVESATAFWSQALGWDARPLSDPAEAHYRVFASPPDQPTVLVQAADFYSALGREREAQEARREAQQIRIKYRMS